VASCTSQSLVPFGSVLRGVCLESVLVCHRELVAKAAAAHVLTFNHELLSIESSNHAVGQVERSLGNGVLCKIIIRFILVHVLGRSNDPEAGFVFLQKLAFLLQTASDQRLCGSVVLVGEADVGHAAWGSVGVDQDLVVTLDETVPLEVWCDLSSSASHVSIHCTGLLGLSADNLVELGQAVLDGGENVGLELGEAVLDGDDIVAIVILLDDLLVQAVVDTTLKDVGVFVSTDLASGAFKGSCVLTKLLNVLLRGLAGLVDKLASLSSTFCELLGLILDLGVETLEDGEDRALESLCCFGVRVGNALLLLSLMLVSSHGLTRT